MSKTKDKSIPTSLHISDDGLLRYHVGAHMLVFGGKPLEIIVASFWASGSGDPTKYFVGSRADTIDFLVSNGLSRHEPEWMITDISDYVAELKTKN